MIGMKKYSSSILVALGGNQQYLNIFKFKELLFFKLANVGAFIFGTMLSWSAQIAHQMIENPDYEIWVTSEVFGWIVGIMALGGTLSAVCSGYIRSILGTKLTIIIFTIPMTIGFLIITFASNVAMVKLKQIRETNFKAKNF